MTTLPEIRESLQAMRAGPKIDADVATQWLVAFLQDELLERRGIRDLGPAAKLEQALQLVSEQSPAAAILDLNLHGHPAFPIADELLARGIPLIFATGYDASVIPEKYRHIPRWEKPFDPMVLTSALSKLIPR